MARQAYPSAVRDDAWAFVAPSLTRMTEAALFASRTLQATPARGPRAGDDGAQRRRGTQVHMAVETQGHRLALQVTAAEAQDRSQVTTVAAKGPEGTGDAVAVACVDRGDTGKQAAQDAETQQMRLEVVKLPEAKKGFVRLPRRWVVERRHAWAVRLRRLARDDARWAETLVGLPCVACAILMRKRFVALMV